MATVGTTETTAVAAATGKVVVIIRRRRRRPAVANIRIEVEIEIETGIDAATVEKGVRVVNAVVVGIVHLNTGKMNGMTKSSSRENVINQIVNQNHRQSEIEMFYVILTAR